jgi:transcriptional regulator with XRE-family HTH domain
MRPVTGNLAVLMTGAELARERADVGLSQGELARHSGVSRPYISACEKAADKQLSDTFSRRIREELRKAALEKGDREDAMRGLLEELESSLSESGPRPLADVPPHLRLALELGQKAGRLVIEPGESQDRHGRFVRRKMVSIVNFAQDTSDVLGDLPLSTLRLAGDLSPADAAEVTGVSVSLYRRWESDAQSQPRGRHERLVARAEESLGRLGPEDLKELREQACSSRAEAARRQGVSWTAVDSWESGSRWPSLANLARYVALLRSELALARELLQQEATALSQLTQQVASDPGALSFGLAVQWLGPVGGLGRASRTPALVRGAIERGEFHLRPTDYMDAGSPRWPDGRLRRHDGLFLGRR